MTTLYLVSPKPYAGKSVIGLAMGNHVHRRGSSVRIFKPLGPYPTQIGDAMTDRDAYFVAQSLGIDTPPELLCPVPLTPALKEQALISGIESPMPAVTQAFEQVKEDAEVSIVLGTGSLFSTGAPYRMLSWDVAEALDAFALVVARYEPERMMEDLVAARRLFGERMIGAIINAVRSEYMGQVVGMEVPYLEREGIPVYGVLPEEPMLHGIPIRELVQPLNARVLIGEEYLDQLIEQFSIGAISQESALSHFRKLANKAVVIASDRSDIQRAALETSLRALILTGGDMPANIILSLAYERKVPVLLVKEDTLTTIERIENQLGQLRVRQPRSLERVERLFNEFVDLNRLWERCDVHMLL